MPNIRLLNSRQDYIGKFSINFEKVIQNPRGSLHLNFYMRFKSDIINYLRFILKTSISLKYV